MRHNKAFTGAEYFEYDSQDRLIELTGAITEKKDYHKNGNIQESSEVGVYNYDPATMYRVMGIDLNEKGHDHFTKHTPQQIAYNAFKKPLSIQQGDKKVDFDYGAFMNRTHAYYGGTNEDKTQRDFTKLYSSIAPIEVILDHKNNSHKVITYIMGDAYTAPIAHISTQEGGDTVQDFVYLHRDYLGSINAITDSEGAVLEETHYTAWGEVAQYADAKGNATLGYQSILGRGYTGHEHFNSVGLIHMNGHGVIIKLQWSFVIMSE